MKSKDKYWDRAYEILPFYVTADREEIVEAMCKLAEEVEKETISKILSSNPIDKIYIDKLKDEIGLFVGVELFDREEVEVLLTKQRELCASKADVKFIKSDVPNCFIRDYNDYTSRLAVADEDSILNAKLNID